MHYFVKRGEKVQGPLSREQLIAFVRGKKILGSDLVGNTPNGPFQDFNTFWNSLSSSPENSANGSPKPAHRTTPPALPKNPKPQSCHACGSSLSPYSNFCAKCGNPLHEPKISKAQQYISELASQASQVVSNVTARMNEDDVVKSDTSNKSIEFSKWYKMKFGVIPVPAQILLWVACGVFWIPTWWFRTRKHGTWPERPGWVGIILWGLFTLGSLGLSITGTTRESFEVNVNTRFAKDMWGRTRLDRLEHDTRTIEYDKKLTSEERIIYAYLAIGALTSSILCYRHRSHLRNPTIDSGGPKPMPDSTSHV